MKLARITLVLCAVAWLAAADGGLLGTKTRLLGKLGRHNKRGVHSTIPTYKLGHDIPHVTHSVIKPLVVTYPPAAAVHSVKVPLSHPFLPRHPLPVGHRVPVPHPHFGLKFPHTKTFVHPKPDQHFHHHHHHVAPRPVIPIAPAVPVPAPTIPAPPPQIIPIPQPSAPVAHPLPAPPPFFIRPTHLFPSHPVPVSPPPVPIVPHAPQFTPLLPATAVPLRPAPVFPPPAIPFAPQLQYVIRPGNSVQTSFFATYPRYPLVNYQQLIPLPPPAAVAPAPAPVLFERPHVPHFHVAPSTVLPQPPPVAVQPTQTILHETHAVSQPEVHLHPTQQVAVEHDGWAPVPNHPHEVPQFQQPQEHHHFIQEPQPQHHFAQEPQHHFSQEPQPQFTQEQGQQVYEHHTGEEQQYHDFQHQLQHHIQQQLEQAQFEQHVNNQLQLNQEYGAPQQLGQEYGQPNGEYSHQDSGHQGQDFGQHHDYNLQQPGLEYGTPGVEGRSSSESEGEELRYHNHIPLGLQPPLDRPLDHFR